MSNFEVLVGDVIVLDTGDKVSWMMLDVNADHHVILLTKLKHSSLKSSAQERRDLGGQGRRVMAFIRWHRDYYRQPHYGLGLVLDTLSSTPREGSLTVLGHR